MKNLPRFQFFLMIIVLFSCLMQCKKEKPKPTRAELIIEKAKIDSIQQTQKKLANEKANIPFVKSDSVRDAFWK